jgi:H+-transporting ATPase
VPISSESAKKISPKRCFQNPGHTCAIFLTCVIANIRRIFVPVSEKFLISAIFPDGEVASGTSEKNCEAARQMQQGKDTLVAKFWKVTKSHTIFTQEPTMNTEEKEEAAPARTTDAVADVEAGTGASQQRRQHAYSDLTGFIVPVERHRPPREDRRTVSDMVLMRTLPEEVVAGAAAGRRKKTTSSADVIQKFGYVPSLGYADLDLAEVIQHHGPRRERIASGLSDMVMVEAMEEKEEVEEFPINEKGLTSEEAAKLIEQYGKNELPEKVESKWLVFGRLLIQPMPCLIWVAVIIEAAIENFLDMGILLAILFINASISFYETNKAGNAIAALKNSLKPTATAKRDGKFVTMDATLLVPGDTVLLASGSAIPADCRINHGDIEVDQSALTGESLPVTFYKNDSCKMGSTVVRGEVEATVEFTGANTFFGKTASLLQENHEPSHLQKILMTIMKVLVGLSLTLCIINFIYL